MNKLLWLAAIMLSILSAERLSARPDLPAGPSKLAIQRRDAARKTYEATWANYRERRASEDTLYRWSLRWLEAERQLSERPSDQVAAYQGHFDRMSELENLVSRVQRTGQTTIEEVSATEFYRVEAEIWLLQAKEKKDR